MRTSEGALTRTLALVLMLAAPRVAAQEPPADTGGAPREWSCTDQQLVLDEARVLAETDLPRALETWESIVRRCGEEPSLRALYNVGWGHKKLGHANPAMAALLRFVGLAEPLRGQSEEHDRFLRNAKSAIGELRAQNGELVVAALVAVNAVGDVVDPATGRVVAGARGEDGRTLVDARVLVRSGLGSEPPVRANTTIGVIATNAKLTKTDANRVAQVAHDGLARSIAPAHTPGDGDTLFVLATGAIDAPSLLVVGELAAQAVAEAVLRAVREATGVEGYPAVRDLAPSAARDLAPSAARDLAPSAAPTPTPR